MQKCPHCGRENDETFRFCLDCGNPLAATGDEIEVKAPESTVAPKATAAPKANAAPATDPESGIPTGPVPTASKPKAPIAKPTSKPVPKPAPAPEAKPNVTEPEPVPPPADPQPAPPPAAAGDADTCPSCGAAAAPGAAFCAGCGQKLDDPANKGSTMFMHQVSPDAEAKIKVRLVLIKPDGSEGTVFTLAARTAIGRTQGMIMFPKDPYISPKHAEIRIEDSKPTVSDLGSLNGVYRRMTSEERIAPGTYFRIGRQLLRLEVPGDFQSMPLESPDGDDSQYWGSPAPQVWARLVQVLEGGKIGEIHLLTQAEVLIGREDGEVRFPEDGFISSRHCKLLNKEGDCFLDDMGSSNGTYLRITEDHALTNGDRIQIGNQVLRVDVG